MKIITSFDEGSTTRFIGELLATFVLAIVIAIALAVSAGAEPFGCDDKGNCVGQSVTTTAPFVDCHELYRHLEKAIVTTADGKTIALRHCAMTCDYDDRIEFICTKFAEEHK